ncbi:hypothetical protein QTP70_019976 [Hemibagrus guttatus]|uniref:Thioredoxin domain-containing protein n=1 Tax=Hemibagrus guttatus TaxID=175788 RepID=A0AAE0R9N5_9TELE|nr:hypothetical protein QTP70_019976 [Hemibagrus guttatus]KAK3567705.1 hypothetical protein QTP86_021629 [Hemibagrus guttatus]
MVIVIESKDEFEAALKNAGNKLVVVDFTATWCGPCQMIGPFFKEVASACEIKCMPTFQFYKHGKKVEEFSGANKDTLEATIKKHN